MSEKKDNAVNKNTPEPLDPHNLSVGLTSSDGTDIEAEMVAAGEIPDELAGEYPDRSDEPKTGLVAEFHDLSFGQASYLVGNRETATVSRSPMFYLTTLIAGLVVLAGLVYGFAQATPKTGADTTLITVGMGQQQADMAAQQLGVKVTDVESAEAAEELLRNGQGDAAYIPDLTGQGQPQIIALDREPTAIMEALAGVPNVTYLESPPVSFAVAQPLAIGLAGLLIAAALTLGFALYQNLRLEKRNHLAEVIAAAIPARASAWGRVQGLSLLSLVHLLVAAVILLLGLSIGSYSSMAMALLPALGWFALAYLFTVATVLSLFAWAGSLAGRRARQVFAGVISVLAVAGAFAPLFFTGNKTVMQWLSYAPLTSPVAAALRLTNGNAQWWEGLIAAGVTLVVAIIVFYLAASAYQQNLLKGAGRAGRTAKISKKGTKAAAGGSGKAGDEKAKSEAKAGKKDAEATAAEKNAEKKTGKKEADTADSADDSANTAADEKK